jgi:hypothetical protein
MFKLAITPKAIASATGVAVQLPVFPAAGWDHIGYVGGWGDPVC